MVYWFMAVFHIVWEWRVMEIVLWGFIGQNLYTQSEYTQSKTTSRWSHKPKIDYDWASPNPYLDQPITSRWCQPTDIPTATRLGLCSSFVHRWVSVIARNSGKLLPNTLTSAVPLHHPAGQEKHTTYCNITTITGGRGATLDQGKLSKWRWILNL